MYTSKIISALALAATAAKAQTPPGWGFTPAVSNTLNITFQNGNDVSPAGELIPRPDTASPPTIQISPVVFNATKAVLFMIDLDVPRNNSRVTLLHWFAPNVVNSNGTLAFPISSNNPNIGAPYLQPSPPVGDSAHRYTFLLFPQPEGFNIPASFSSINPPADSNARIGFNLTSFIAASGLQSTPVAANYIQVQNLTASATTSYPPAGTASITGSATSALVGASSSIAGSSSALSTATVNAAGAMATAAGAVGAGLLGLAAVVL